MNQSVRRSTWFFRNESRQLFRDVHLDDGHGVAQSEKDVKTLMSEFSQLVRVREWSVYRLGERCAHLKRCFEPGDPMSATCRQILVASRKLGQLLDETGNRQFKTPSVELTDSEVEQATELSETGATRCRGCVGFVFTREQTLRTSKTKLGDSATKCRPQQHLTKKNLSRLS